MYVFKRKGIEKKQKHQTCHCENITTYELVIQIINIVLIVITVSLLKEKNNDESHATPMYYFYLVK